MPGETKLGNTSLVRYGIQDYSCDLMIHVAVEARKVYMYPTESGKIAIDSGKYRTAPAFINGIQTARGYLVPPGKIEGCKWFDIPDDLLNKYRFEYSASTSIKGNKAEQLVKEMIEKGLLPLIVDVKEVEDYEQQLKGNDLEVICASSYQVKCDWKAGHKVFGGTGNLFLQVEECNPFGMH
ncbi:MAG: hypothetical protein ACXAB9_15140 [Candidatus Thorarchaeota archaeon]